MNKFKITDFEICDHGIDHAQYFQGCGTSYTRFDYVQTGCGENAREAFDDALEQIAMCESVDLSPIETSKEGKTYQTKRAEKFSVSRHLRREHIKLEEDEDCELYYYLSIRYNLGASDETALRSAGLHSSQV